MLGYTPIGFVDDDARKRNLAHPRRPRARDDGRAAADRARAPAGRGADRDPVRFGRGAPAGRRGGAGGNVPVKTLPGLYELISGDLDLPARSGRCRSRTSSAASRSRSTSTRSRRTSQGQTVLVTGAGGSIGAELCRQIARIGPARLILVDQAETPLFEIERELVGERGFSAAVPVLADVRARARRLDVFERYRPRSSSMRPRTSTCR